MRYLIALLCPPLAILMCGHLLLALISIPLLVIYFPSALLALLVVSSYQADRRNMAVIDAMERQNDKLIKAHNKAAKQQAKALDLHAKTAELRTGRQDAALGFEADQDEEEAEPRKPLITFAQIKHAVNSAKSGAIFAYQNLPEWAQPISWGLAAGTPISIVVAILFINKK